MNRRSFFKAGPLALAGLSFKSRGAKADAPKDTILHFDRWADDTIYEISYHGVDLNAISLESSWNAFYKEYKIAPDCLVISPTGNYMRGYEMTEGILKHTGRALMLGDDRRLHPRAWYLCSSLQPHLTPVGSMGVRS